MSGLRGPGPRWNMWRPGCFLGALLLSVCPPVAAQNRVRVHVERTPDGGIQPQVAVDHEGGLHLIYFKGEAHAGDLYYVRRSRTETRFSKPVRVNSTPGSAIAIGTIRGGQIALGRTALGQAARVHVAWNGSGRVTGEHGVPMLYTRMNDEGSGFEPERNLMRRTETLDGGGTLAADRSGKVIVAWHALAAGRAESGSGGEQARRVWIASSTDSGETFTEELPAWERGTGACGCCSMRALATGTGALHLLYRSASGGTRDIYHLAAPGASGGGSGNSFEGGRLHGWELAGCPMSSMALAAGADRVVSAWETEGQIYYSWGKPGATELTRPLGVLGANRMRKHPALALNARGELLVAWTEGTGWNRGGDLVWQVLDRDGKPTEQHGRLTAGVPVWGLPAAAARGDDFVLFH